MTTLKINTDEAFKQFSELLATEFEFTEEQHKEMHEGMKKCFFGACQAAKIIKSEKASKEKNNSDQEEENTSNEENNDEKKTKKQKTINGYNLWMSRQMKGLKKSMPEAVKAYQALSKDEKEKLKLEANKINKKNGNKKNKQEKKQPNGYNLFMSDAMKKEGGLGLALPDAIRAWQALSDDEKSEWKVKANDLQ